MKILFVINDPDSEPILAHGGLARMITESVADFLTRKQSGFLRMLSPKTDISIVSVAPHLHRQDAEKAAAVLPRDEATLSSFDAVIMSGSVMNVTDIDREPWMQALMSWMLFMVQRNRALITARNKTFRKENDDDDTVPQQPTTAAFPLPIFAVCFSHQLFHHALGGVVRDMIPEGGDEWGCFRLTFHEDVKREVQSDDPVFGPIARQWPSLVVSVTHGQSVTKLAPGFVAVAGTEKLANHATSLLDAFVFTTQFHPESRVPFLRDLLLAAHLDDDGSGQVPYFQDPKDDFSAIFLASFLDFALMLKASHR